MSPQAVHQQKQATLGAIEQLRIIVSRNPRDARSIWLLNLAMALADQDRGQLPRSLQAQAIWRPNDPKRATAPWHDRAPELGVDAVDLAGGAVLDDFDGDGLLDIVTSTWDRVTA